MQVRAERGEESWAACTGERPRWRRRARGLREGDADKRGPLVSRTGTNAAEPERELLWSGVTRAEMLG